MRPANTTQAQQKMLQLLGNRIPGRRTTKVKEHRERAKHIADTLYRHFQVGPYQYRLKHLLWYLNTHIQPLQAATQYRHWLTARQVVIALERWQHWQPRLVGSWMRP